MHGRTQRAGADPTRPDPEVGNGLVERERATSLSAQKGRRRRSCDGAQMVGVKKVREGGRVGKG